ncbi:Oidioi.mRNA.OKI2018_I69.PAR.g9421.t1.cds [Oikopleura dioica]|uniref:Oidioi.mRNA.OKI2018_I69.PAR.g9421.t1.cds n=1 Tax=Oikopleura dioica TaxID=34765 RepID=A0ABN7RQY4_OIKDI|nr:Oidioi.mRNA.OKI2018_I69.PAR.g9421.t1.cds [Oikopleura dioica]
MKILTVLSALVLADNLTDDRILYIMTGPRLRHPCYLKKKVETSAGGIYFAEKSCGVKPGNIVLEKSPGSDFSDILGQVKRIRPVTMRLDVEVHVKFVDPDQLEPVNDDDYERFAAENIDEKEMYTNYDGVSLDDLPFEELSDFEREKVFGEDEDYDVMFREPEEVFSIYGKGGGIVGARLAREENLKTIGTSWIPALVLIGIVIAAGVMFKNFVKDEMANQNEKYGS